MKFPTPKNRKKESCCGEFIQRSAWWCNSRFVMEPSVHNHVQNPYANALCVLKVNCKCEQCKMTLMSVLSSISGVYSVNVDAERGLAEIEGQVDPNHLLQEVSRSGQHAELVRVRLQHPAARQRYSSLSSSYDRECNNNYYYGRSMNAIQDGYGRRALLNDEPCYVNGDARYYNNSLSYELPETSNYVNSRYNMNDYGYSSGARYVPSPVPREYIPYEDETLSCTIL